MHRTVVVIVALLLLHSVKIDIAGHPKAHHCHLLDQVRRLGGLADKGEDWIERPLVLMMVGSIFSPAVFFFLFDSLK